MPASPVADLPASLFGTLHAAAPGGPPALLALAPLMLAPLALALPIWMLTGRSPLVDLLP